MRNTIITATGLLLLFSCGQNKDSKIITEEKTAETTAPATQPEKQCFLKVVKKDSIIFEIEPAGGDSIYGIFHWKPYEKDKKIASYKGTMQGSEGKAIAFSRPEGMDYTEEVLFTVADGRITIKYGEMTEGTDGVWRLKEPDAAFVEILEKVECD